MHTQQVLNQKIIYMYTAVLSDRATFSVALSDSNVESWTSTHARGQWSCIAASIYKHNNYGSYILGKHSCGPKSQVMFKCMPMGAYLGHYGMSGRPFHEFPPPPPTLCLLSSSLSLTHTHTHTHTQKVALSMRPFHACKVGT